MGKVVMSASLSITLPVHDDRLRCFPVVRVGKVVLSASLSITLPVHDDRLRCFPVVLPYRYAA